MSVQTLARSLFSGSAHSDRHWLCWMLVASSLKQEAAFTNLREVQQFRNDVFADLASLDWSKNSRLGGAVAADFLVLHANTLKTSRVVRHMLLFALEQHAAGNVPTKIVAFKRTYKN